MKRIGKGLLVIIFIVLFAPMAEAQFSGQDLVDEWKAYQRVTSKSSGKRTDQVQAADYMGFLQGVWDTASYYDFTPHGAGKGMTVHDLCRLVGKYLERHPERWHEPAVILVMDALNEAFPSFPTRRKPKP
jgi:hypothetical protein